MTDNRDFDNRKKAYFRVLITFFAIFYGFVLLKEVSSLASFCGMTLLVGTTSYICLVNIYYAKPGKFEKFSKADIPKNQLMLFVMIFSLLSLVGLIALMKGI